MGGRGRPPLQMFRFVGADAHIRPLYVNEMKVTGIRYFPRKSPRLTGYDYSTEGAYFITFCVQDRLELLGTLSNEANNPVRVKLSAYGEIVDKYIKRVPGLQKYVIMPNHIHMIISISCDNELSVTQRISSLKTLITKELGFSIFQRSFHDHIIRNEKEYLQIWEYIENNPVNWATDCFYKRI